MSLSLPHAIVRVRTLSLLLLAAFGPLVLHAEDSPPDPALALRAKNLTAEDEKLVRGWMTELGSDDFEVRNRALSNIVSKGPAVVAIAQEFFNDKDREVASLSKSVRSRILLDYDGFLPTDPALKELLARPGEHLIEWQRNSQNRLAPVLTLRAFCEKNKIKFELDPASAASDMAYGNQFGTPDEFMLATNRSIKASPLGDTLQFLATLSRTRCIPRGDVLLLTSPENAARLAVQRHTFDWSNLEFKRDEAARAEKELTPFFSSPDIEVHSGSNALQLRGPEEALLRAARLIALLNPKAPDAAWPPSDASVDAALVERLSGPAPVQISSDDPAAVTKAFKKWNVRFQGSVVLHGTDDIFAMATLNLNFSQGAPPLGIVLRWCERRARIVRPPEQPVLAFEINEKNQLLLTPRAAPFSAADPVGGADVSFLYKAPPEFNAESDAAARKQLLEAFASHLAIFPALDDQRFRVFRGRLLVQAPSATLRRVLALVADWRKSGKPPETAPWRTALESALDAEIDWNGQGLTGGKLLPLLRRLGKINLLLEDGPDGAANFELSRKDSELLPPGRYTVRALLNELAARAKARWQAELGAIVLTPK